LAKIITHCEAIQAHIENITFQMNSLSFAEQNKHLAGPIALMKIFASRSAHEIADEAVEIFATTLQSVHILDA
jgi:alkylation response protein AidB-like acyl-CoA dehydrogenase